MKKALIVIIPLIFLVGAVVLFAYRGTWGKVDIEFTIHINEKLVQESVFGESPTFAIWLEDTKDGMKQTIFVTRRAASGDWEGKARVPVALPRWYQVYQEENKVDDLPTFEKPAPLAISGATPKPGYFKTRARVDPGSKWICWIEMNLSGDYNEFYKEYDQEKNIEDEFGSGQPALLYKAEIFAIEGTVVNPEIEGMSVSNSNGDILIQPLEGITTADKVFDELSIAIVKPNPKILN